MGGTESGLLPVQRELSTLTDSWAAGSSAAVTPLCFRSSHSATHQEVVEHYSELYGDADVLQQDVAPGHRTTSNWFADQ